MFLVFQIQERLNRIADLARRSLQPRSPGQHRELGKLKRKRKWKRASSKFGRNHFVKYRIICHYYPTFKAMIAKMLLEAPTTVSLLLKKSIFVDCDDNVKCTCHEI